MVEYVSVREMANKWEKPKDLRRKRGDIGVQSST